MLPSACRRLPAVEALPIVLWILLFSCAFVSTVSARTWYIRVDGSGDAPTIQAGIDSASWGDIVLVAPGTYAIPVRIDMKSGIVLQSEQGPYNTIIKPAPSEEVFGSVISVWGLGDCTVDGFWIKPYYGSGTPCLNVRESNTIMISNNIIESSTWCVWIYYSDWVYLHNNLIMGEGGSGAGVGITFWPDALENYTEVVNNIVMNRIVCEEEGHIEIRCNDILGYPDCFIMTYNFSLDPQFCGVSGGMNYYLQSDSPCAPGNDPVYSWCGLIGPLPVGCGTVDVEKKSWGEIKTLYQE